MSYGTVLIVEDDVHIVELLKFNLEKNGYDVLSAQNGMDGLEMARSQNPDLMLLDLMLPKLDGVEVCRQLRAEKATASLPVIMLTAKGTETDKVLGLELGADDYMTKPFSVRELLARIKAVLRRAQGEPVSEGENKTLVIEDLIIDIDRHVVSRKDEIFQLTFKEFELLKELAINRGKVLTRNYLLDEIWGYDYYGETRTVDVHVRHLRRKIETGDYRYIETIRGVGYKVR